MILVQEINDTDPGRERERPLFESIIPEGKIEDSLAREKGTTIWLLRNAKVSINDILKNEINKKKMGIED